MATRPGEPSQLGKFFDYPSDATGQVLPYWLASSPGSGHRVRMTGACKRAFLATIEAVIERALVPANCDTTPSALTDFRNMALDAQGLRSLVLLGKWAAVADRAGLGARLKRGCPREDWNLLVSLVSALWSYAAANLDAGTVYAWQTSMLDFETNGWVDGPISVYASCLDLSFSVADNAYVVGDPIALRLWGDFPGGTGGYPVVEWVSDALRGVGASVMDPSMTPGGYADGELNGAPAPLKVGHEGNWFGSTSGAMVGLGISARRSSSAWAVLQSMLANMRFTHLKFPYEVTYSETCTTRTIVRVISMDENGDIFAAEIEDQEEEEELLGTTTDLHAVARSSLVEGLCYIGVQFYCEDSWVTVDNPLVRFSPPDNDSGWVNVGADIEDYLTLGPVHTDGARLTLQVDATTDVDSVSAANGHQYPASGFVQYVDEYGQATFVDSETYAHDPMGETPIWTKYSVKGETVTGPDLTVPVRAHAAWLLNQLPTISWPNIPACPSSMPSLTSAFRNGWRAQYPSTPNVQVDGRDAYFPTKFKNVAVLDHLGWPISFDQTERAWKGGSGQDQGEVFAHGGMAFPGLDTSAFDNTYYRINSAGEAMAAYTWRFKAMPAA